MNVVRRRNFFANVFSGANEHCNEVVNFYLNFSLTSITDKFKLFYVCFISYGYDIIDMLCSSTFFMADETSYNEDNWWINPTIREPCFGIKTFCMNSLPMCKKIPCMFSFASSFFVTNRSTNAMKLSTRKLDSSVFSVRLRSALMSSMSLYSSLTGIRRLLTRLSTDSTDTPGSCSLILLRNMLRSSLTSGSTSGAIFAT